MPNAFPGSAPNPGPGLEVHAMLFLATGVTLIAPWPAVFWYQTGVPFESRIIA